MTLISEMKAKDWLKSPKIIKAFENIKREDFLPEEIRDFASKDTPLPIGFGQTNSQPSVVAFMLELLSPQKGEKVLDIGSGSGWTSALLAYLVGEKGKVFAIEVVPELAEFGIKNINKYNFIKEDRVRVISGDGSKGYLPEAPYDRILASASAKNLPLAWKEQLRPGGRMVVSIRESIWSFEKDQKGKWREKEFPGFVFVPLILKKNN